MYNMQKSIAGTSVVTTEVELPPHIVVSLHDLSVYHMRPDRELLLTGTLCYS